MDPPGPAQGLVVHINARPSSDGGALRPTDAGALVPPMLRWAPLPTPLGVVPEELVAGVTEAEVNAAYTAWLCIEDLLNRLRAHCARWSEVLNYQCTA